MDENKYTDQIRKQDLQKFSKAVGITLGDQDTSVKSGNFRIAPPSRKTVDAIFLVQPEGTAVFLNHIGPYILTKFDFDKSYFDLNNGVHKTFILLADSFNYESKNLLILESKKTKIRLILVTREGSKVFRKIYDSNDDKKISLISRFFRFLFRLFGSGPVAAMPTREPEGLNQVQINSSFKSLTQIQKQIKKEFDKGMRSDVLKSLLEDYKVPRQRIGTLSIPTDGYETASKEYEDMIVDIINGKRLTSDGYRTCPQIIQDVAAATGRSVHDATMKKILADLNVSKIVGQIIPGSRNATLYDMKTNLEKVVAHCKERLPQIPK